MIQARIYNGDVHLTDGRVLQRRLKAATGDHDVAVILAGDSLSTEVGATGGMTRVDILSSSDRLTTKDEQVMVAAFIHQFLKEVLGPKISTTKATFILATEIVVGHQKE